jgi:hypothetical protein
MSFRLLPTPQTMERKPGAIRLADIGRIETQVELTATLSGRIRELFRQDTGPLGFHLVEKAAVPEEGYELSVSEHGIELAVSSPHGARYGIGRLEQLREGDRIGLWTIRDAPALPMRGLHIIYRATRDLTFEQELSLLDSMARWNLNTIVLEYDDRFPYRKHAAIPAPDAFTREQVQALAARARSHGIEVIPLQQCLGHVNFVLRHDEYAAIREEEERRDQWCPLKPQSFDLFRELVNEVVELHGETKYLHMGGDETRRLGVCPECAKVAAESGKGRLYVDFIVKAAEYVRSLGMTPILWDDMVCAHIDVLDDLPRDIVLMYWDYWTTCDPCSMFLARPDGRFQVVDKRWLTEWKNELDPIEQRMIQVFAKPIDMERDLSGPFRDRFGKYLGQHFPKRIRAFPYIEYYRDHGFRVICAGSASGNTSSWRGLPDFPRYAANLETFARRAAEAGALGLLSTMWYTMPYEAFIPGIVYAGQFAWNTSAVRTPPRGLGPD